MIDVHLSANDNPQRIVNSQVVNVSCRYVVRSVVLIQDIGTVVQVFRGNAVDGLFNAPAKGVIFVGG